MKKLIITFTFLVFVLVANSQELALSGTSEIDKIYTKVDEPARHPDGIVKMWEQILKELNYPKEAAENGIKGRVFVSFVVEKDGSLSNIKVAKSLGFGCDEEAIRIAKGLQNWIPAKIEGKTVRSRTILSFLFPPSKKK